MREQYGNSIRFRLLKWLNPLLMTALFVGSWYGFSALDISLSLSVGVQLFLIVAYIALLMWFEKTYHALTVGLLRVSELVYSQALSIFMTNAICYAAISLYQHQFMPVGIMFVVMGAQFMIGAIWCLTANAIYYKAYPAPATVILYRNRADLERIRGIKYFSEHFDVQKEIEDPHMNTEELLDALRGFSVVFVAGIESVLRNDIAKYCVENDIKGYFVPRLGDLIMAGADYMSMFSEPIMKVQRTQVKHEYCILKRLMDIGVSLIGLTVLSPIMAVTALAIKVYDGGPAFYRQQRLTRNGRVFSILKFRSMNVNAEKDGVARLASQNDNRITPIGRLIRATRIDELPQLINILVGDMSLVGPRPERPEIADEYEKILPEFKLRLQVKAGLTGMAQVYGRYNTEPYSKLQMDLMYINKMSLMTDLKLIFSTIKIVFIKESTTGVQVGKTTAATEEHIHNDSGIA